MWTSKNRALRPQQVAISERSDRRRMETDRAIDSAAQIWRRQANRGHARGSREPLLNFEALPY
jgi:hypothetical protein